MSRRHRRKSKESEGNRAKQPNSNNISIITTLLKKNNLRNFSGQLREIADNMEKFGDLVELLERMDIMIKPTEGGSKNSFNLIKMMQDSGSFNHVLQTILPILRDSFPEKKVEPINIETTNTDDQKE